MDRLQQKNSLFIKLGALFGPLLRLVENPDQYDDQERAEIFARYSAEHSELINEFLFFPKGQPGHFYRIEFENFHFALYSLPAKLAKNTDLKKADQEHLANAQAALDAIPVPRTSVILEAGSPFTAYCKLKELCEADATSFLVWLDPFLSASIFHRFLSSIRDTVSVILVTGDKGPHAGKQDKVRWTEFKDIFRLYAKERGPALYCLVIQANLRDSWIVLDGKRIYAPGGSAKDAGNKDYFTITSIEASEQNLQKIQAHIYGGIEFFGPTITHHL